LWQQEIEAALPDIPYVNINLTMPDVLWPHFQKYPGLLHDLPGVAADAIMYWAYCRYGVRLFVMVVPQTFGGLLNFHPHLHVLVSAGGLREADARWISRLRFDKRELMACWKFALIAYLGRLADVLSTEPEQLERALRDQYARRWNVFVSRAISKTQFARYAGRYLRRPPIAEYRLTRISDDEVEYVGKNTRQKQPESMRFTIVEFLNRLMPHVPQHYSHAVRYFGLLAPRAKNRMGIGVLALLGQNRRPRPRRLTWAESLKKKFGLDPLLDSKGQRMRRVGRLLPRNTKPPIMKRTCALE
jgi:hypothetical protein